MWQQAKNIYHLLVAWFASWYYAFPGRGMTVIGVTGTDGKTTTASLIFHILRENGIHAALISTVGATIGTKQYGTGFHVTTPGSAQMQSYLKQARDTGTTHVVLEVTSHALDQNRTVGIPFSIGLITNISHEHLDYHKTYEKYVEAKTKLLHVAKIGIVNKDDKSCPIIRKLVPDKRLFTYGKADADYTLDMVKSFKNNLIGKYNLYNILAATAVCLNLGIQKDAIAKAVVTFRLPKGRTEIVYDGEFRVMIDFAHTPNAFTHLLSTLKKTKHGRIIHVFGAAGRRDASKRPLMGEVASEYDDVIVLTAEDPRNEPVQKIIDEIASGIISVGTVPEVHTIRDRQEAISFALSLARKGDIVAITGKGHEESMNLGKGETPWSDHEAVTKALQTRYEK